MSGTLDWICSRGHRNVEVIPTYKSHFQWKPKCRRCGSTRIKKREQVLPNVVEMRPLSHAQMELRLQENIAAIATELFAANQWGKLYDHCQEYCGTLQEIIQAAKTFTRVENELPEDEFDWMEAVTVYAKMIPKACKALGYGEAARAAINATRYVRKPVKSSGAKNER